MNSFFEGMVLGALFNINKSLSKGNLDAVNEYGYTVLHSALLTNDFSEAKRLILNGANPLLKNINGETPLNLFANNLSVDETYSTFDSQIKLASEADRLSMFAFLIQHGYRDYIFRCENEYKDTVDNGLLFDSVLLEGSFSKKFYDTIVFLTTHGYHKSNRTNSVIDEYQLFNLVRATINEENEGKDTSFNLNLIKLFLEAGFNPFWTYEGESAYSVASENSSVDILNIMPEQTQSYNKVNELLVIQEYEDSCDKGDEERCHALGLMYLNGEGVSKDILKAIELFTKACDGGNGEACFYLARFYVSGTEVRKDLEQAKKLFRKACADGYDKGCEAVVNI